jgi:hypothetical protein
MLQKQSKADDGEIRADAFIQTYIQLISAIQPF